MNPCDKIFQIEILLQNYIKYILMYSQLEILITTNANKWIGIQTFCRKMLDKLEMRKRIIVIADLDKLVKVKLNSFEWTISVKAENFYKPTFKKFILSLPPPQASEKVKARMTKRLNVLSSFAPPVAFIKDEL